MDRDMSIYTQTCVWLLFGLGYGYVVHIGEKIK